MSEGPAPRRAPAPPRPAAVDIRQLEVLLAVADHGSFSNAARHLHTVQSNVSTHVARLEAGLGTVLVDRSTGMLTDEGEAVAARARRIQGELDAIGPDLAAMRDEITGTVRLGIIGTIGRWLLPPLLDRLAHEYPRIHLHVAGATTTNLAPAVSQGTLHLGLVNLPVDDPDLTVEPVLVEDRVLAVLADSPLAGRGRISLDDLAELAVMVAPSGTSFRSEIDDAFRDAGLTLSPRAEIDSMGLLSAAVEAGIGPALLPASALRAGAAVVGVPVRGLSPRSVGLVSNRRVPPSATTVAVVDVVRQIIFAECARRPGLAATGSPPDPDAVPHSTS